MMTKTAYYMQMAQEAAAQITGSKEQWTAFLTTSARLYKYPFAEQLMIYKQRPEATACAEYDLWNDRMNRYVKRGSKGIALLDMRGEQPKLRLPNKLSDYWIEDRRTRTSLMSVQISSSRFCKSSMSAR